MKQAIVLIHGVGEQKPMSTLRSFVSAVLDRTSDGKVPFWSKPDRMSESFELRRLQSYGRPKTHFYEYYWAYNAEGTTIWDVAVWLWFLICRGWRDVPASSKALWLVARFLASGLLGLALLGGLASMQDRFSALKSFGLPWLLLAGLALLLHFFLVFYLGDAARYCSALPRNIRLRQTIRAEGLSLLRALHKDGEYDRIVVVGHSLGSVIGYDLITRLWQEHNELYPGLENPAIQAAIRADQQQRRNPQPALAEISHSGAALGAESSDEEVVEFQKKQLNVWLELRSLGNPWRITDFITLGSPLAHAMLLLADSEADFDSRKSARELPTCPPQRDTKSYAYSNAVGIDIGQGRKFSPLILHHAAPFAATRWTNLYFPTWLGLFGDFVGGRLRPVFGFGIRDVKVSTRWWWGLANFTLWAHTSYWYAADKGPLGKGKRVLALEALRQALNLKDLRHYVPLKPSDATEPTVVEGTDAGVAGSSGGQNV